MAEKIIQTAFTMPHIKAPNYFRQILRPEYLQSIQERIKELYPKVQSLAFPLTGDEWLSVRTKYPLAYIKYKLQSMEENVVNGKIYTHDHAALILQDWLRNEYKNRMTPAQRQQLDDQTISEFPEILRIIRDYNVYSSE